MDYIPNNVIFFFRWHVGGVVAWAVAISWVLWPRALPCSHRMGLRPQRVFIVALCLCPVELDQDATRDRSHRHQTENMTLHDVHVHGEIMGSWRVGRWFGTSLYCSNTECPTHL